VADCSPCPWRLPSHGPGPAARATDLSPRVLLHARVANLSQPCQPVIAGCGAATVQGGLNQLSGAGDYFVYLLAGRFDPRSASGKFTSDSATT